MTVPQLGFEVFISFFVALSHGKEEVLCATNAAQPSPYPHLTCKASLLQISVYSILGVDISASHSRILQGVSDSGCAFYRDVVNGSGRTLSIPSTSHLHVPPRDKTADGPLLFHDRQSVNGGDYYLHALYTSMLYQVRFLQTYGWLLGLHLFDELC